MPGAAALVRREEGSTAQKSSGSPRDSREEEIMMEPIPRVEEEAAEVIIFLDPEQHPQLSLVAGEGSSRRDQL